jgi:hypothetical protein
MKREYEIKIEIGGFGVVRRTVSAYSPRLAVAKALGSMENPTERAQLNTLARSPEGLRLTITDVAMLPVPVRPGCDG